MNENTLPDDLTLDSSVVSNSTRQEMYILSQISFFLYYEYKKILSVDEVKAFISTNNLDKYIDYDADIIDNKLIAKIKEIMNVKDN